MTPTNINFTPQKYAGAVGLDRSPAPASKLTLAGTPAQPRQPCRFTPLQEKKTSGTEVGGPARKAKVGWLQKVCRLQQVCQFQFWSTSIVKVRHCHDSVKIHSVIFIRSSEQHSIRLVINFTQFMHYSEFSIANKIIFALQQSPLVV